MKPKLKPIFELYKAVTWLLNRSENKPAINEIKMENRKVFTPENINNLIGTCEKIVSVSKVNIDGALMWSQMSFLGKLIEDFVNNPIVYESGISMPEPIELPKR